MPEFEISQDDVTCLLNDLDASKSHGPDKLPTKFLKLFSIEISPCLTLIFAAYLHQGTVPQH